MADEIDSPVSGPVPGVSTRSATTPPLEAQSTSGEAGGRVAPPSPVAFGGNPTGRTRKDGLKPGSPEALEADKRKNRERMAAKRAAEKAEQPPAPLPAPATPLPAPGAVAPQAGPVESALVPAPVPWSADDFKQVAPDTIELLEQWRVQAKIELAESGKLAPRVVQQIAKDAAFPGPAKRSLQGASPDAIAKLFNAMNVPVALKPYISTCPTLVYLVVRDVQQTSDIKKLIAEERARAASPSAPPKP